MKNLLLLFFLCLFFNFNSSAQADSISDPKIDKVVSIVGQVEERANFIDQLTDSVLSLPAGIIKTIGAARYIIAIDSVKFKPNGAYFNAYAAIDFPGTTKKLAFEAQNIKFNPKGVVGGNQARLMLVSEHTIKINNTVSLQLRNDGNNWVEWDCGGFKAISLKGYFVFSKGKLRPDSTQTSDSTVTASFQIYTQDIHDFVTQVQITPFTVQGLKNWSFKVTNAVVDMSELTNAPGMAFPAGYSNPNMITAQMWTGFYLQSLQVKLPSEISRTAKRTEISINNLLIDHMGLSGFFQVNNLFSTGEGSMSGWDFSIDELGVGFLCNQLNSGHIKGKVSIPIADSSQALTYNASVYYNPQEKETDYNFTIAPATTLRCHVFSAELDLLNTSYISVVKSNGLFKPKAVLNGYISFKNDRFNSNGGQLKFQDLTIITQSPYLTNGVFTLHNINGNQTRASKFPVSINDISFGIMAGAPVLGFSVTLNPIENVSSGFGVGTRVELFGRITAQQQNYNGATPVSFTKTKWEFDRVSISGFSIDLQTSPFTLKGQILFRNNDPVYGDGFFGHIAFAIKDVLPEPVQINVCFGAKDSYRYFYVDAAVPVEIPLGDIPITLTRLMGGLYYHMSPNNASPTQLIAASQNMTSSVSNALSYVPDPNISLGFKAGVGFIYSPSEEVLNGDVMLEVAFTSSGGLSFIKLSGDVYTMATVSEHPKAPVKGTVVIQYDALNKVFDANSSVTINAYNAITGTGVCKLHIEPGTWYVCVGKPSGPVNVNILNMVTAQSYFMVGNSIEPANAPPPEVSAIINQSGLAAYRNQSKLQSGAGFCTGAKIYSNMHKEFGFSFFNVYGGFDFGLGFDMMMMNYGTNAHCAENGNKAGLNGWVASGDMYIYLQGSVGVKGSISWPPGCDCKNPICYCKDFDLKIFDAGIAAMVNGKMPKPVFASGQFACYYDILGKVSGNFNFDYTYGNDCSVVN